MDLDAFLSLFGKNLKRARWAKGLTQEQVAAEGITYRYYQELERGQRNPTLETIHFLSEVLDVPVAFLVDADPKATARTHKKFSSLDLEAPRRGRKPKPSRGKAPSKGRQRG